MTDLSSLSGPVDGDPPSGPNLEYDLIFTDMELAAQYGGEQQVGDSIIEAESPDFNRLSDTARAVLTQSHDLRAAVYLAEAQLARGGLTDFADVVALIATYLQDYWDSCHPQPDEDDGDVTMRINAVAALADRTRLIPLLRRAALTQSRAFGRMSLRDVEIVDGRLPPPATGPVPDAGTLQAAFKDTSDADVTALRDAVALLVTAVAAIEATFSTHTPGSGPALDGLTDTLRGIQQAFSRYLGGPVVDIAPVADAGSATAPGPSFRAETGAISGPDDVVAALDRIMTYYRTSEPSSPLPIILARAKRLVRADFITIIKDMAADGLDEVNRIGGIKDDD